MRLMAESGTSNAWRDHHFPGDMEEVAEAALESSGRVVADVLPGRWTVHPYRSAAQIEAAAPPSRSKEPHCVVGLLVWEFSRSHWWARGCGVALICGVGASGATSIPCGWTTFLTEASWDPD